MSLPTKLKGKRIKKKGHRRENNITGEVTFKKSSSDGKFFFFKFFQLFSKQSPELFNSE
jgi:hypothetical protein